MIIPYLISLLVGLILVGLYRSFLCQLRAQILQFLLLLFLRQRCNLFGRLLEINVFCFRGMEFRLSLTPELLATLVAK